MACDYLDPLPQKLRTELIGRVTILASQLGPKDSEALDLEFNLKPQEYKLTELPANKAYLRLDETVLITLPESEVPDFGSAESIVNRSSAEYSVPRENIESKIASFIEGV